MTLTSPTLPDIGLVNSQGALDANGGALVLWNIPNKQALRGLNLHAAYLTRNQITNQVVSISRPISIFIS